MSPTAIRVIAVAAVYGCALLGLRLSAALPHPHLGAETKDVVKLAMGLVATMTALILGFLVASARDSYNAQKCGML